MGSAFICCFMHEPNVLQRGIAVFLKAHSEQRLRLDLTAEPKLSVNAYYIMPSDLLLTGIL